MGALPRLVLGFFLARSAARRSAAAGAPSWFGLVRTFGVRRALPIALALSAIQYFLRRQRPAVTPRPVQRSGQESADHRIA
jgi:hypothetical protein